MSKFSDKHPKLAAAFNGAVKTSLMKKNLKISGIASAFGAVAGGLTITGLAVAGVPFLVPVAVAVPMVAAWGATGGFLGSTGYDAVSGAYNALKAYNKNNPPKP